MSPEPFDQERPAVSVELAIVAVLDAQTRQNDAVTRALESLALQADKYDAKLESLERDVRFLDERLESMQRTLDYFTADALGSRSVESESGREGKHGR